VSALVQARNEREEMGVERQEGLRKRVKEMEMAHGEMEGGAGRIIRLWRWCGLLPSGSEEGRIQSEPQ